MVQVLGNAATGNAHHERPLGLPRPPDGIRPAHRPWCRDCKRHHDTSDLDSAGLCARCARAAASRTAAAARRGEVVDMPTAPAAPQPPPTPQPSAKKTDGRANRGQLDRHRASITQRYLAGESCAAIAKTYGVTGGAINKRLHDWGVPVRDRNDHRRRATTGGRP